MPAAAAVCVCVSVPVLHSLPSAHILSAIDPTTGKPLDDSQVKAEIGTFMMAGFETTSHAISWTLALLVSWLSLRGQVGWHDRRTHVFHTRVSATAEASLSACMPSLSLAPASPDKLAGTQQQQSSSLLHWRICTIAMHLHGLPLLTGVSVAMLPCCCLQAVFPDVQAQVFAELQAAGLAPAGKLSMCAKLFGSEGGMATLGQARLKKPLPNRCANRQHLRTFSHT